MFDAGSAIGTLGLDVSGYTSAILQAQGLAGLFPSIVTNFMVNPLLAVADAAKSAGAAIVGMVRESIDAADNLNDLAKAVGVGVEQISALGLAMEYSGGNTAMAADMLKFLGRAMVEAADGKDVAATFDMLGVSATDASGRLRDPLQVLLQLSDAFKRGFEGDPLSGLADSAMRTKTAMELFGRSGTEGLSFLSEGSASIQRMMDRAAASGAVVTASMAKQSDAFNDSMTQIAQAWTGVKNTLAEPIRDALMPYLDQVTAWIEAHPQEIRDSVLEIASAVASAARVAADAILFVLEHLDTIIKVIGVAGLVLAVNAGVKALASLGEMFVGLVGKINLATVAQLRFNAAQAAGMGAGIGGAAFGGVGGSVGGAIGAVVGNMIAPGVGGIVGSLAGGFIGSKIEEAVTPAKIEVKVEPAMSHREVAKQTADLVEQKMLAELDARDAQGSAWRDTYSAIHSQDRVARAMKGKKGGGQ